MSPGSSSGEARRFYKRVTHGVKKVLKRGKAPASDTPSPSASVVPVNLPPPLASSIELAPTPAPNSPAQSQKSILPPQPVPSTSLPAPTASPVTVNKIHVADVEPTLALIPRITGADAWAELKDRLQLLEKNAPPLASAVAGFLEVVDVFKRAAQSRPDCAELALYLRVAVDQVQEYPGEYVSFKMSGVLKAMANGLRKEMGLLEEQRLRSRRRLGSIDMQSCYLRVGELCRELQDKALVDIQSNQGQMQLDERLDQLEPNFKATYASSFSQTIGRRMCTSGTRKTVLAEMREWTDDSGSPKVFWLDGMAGTGKTTLAYCFCAEMQFARRLGASFFCSRGDPDCRDVSRILPTIAYQLARLLPAYREVLIQLIDEDSDIKARTTKTQFEKLIRDPLREVEASVPEGMVVMIDALDECDIHDGARDILSVLLVDARDLPIKFFVTCRPEPWLFEVFQSKDERDRSVLHLHDVDAPSIHADIKTYLEAELAGISLPQEKLRQLAEQAGNLFVWAAAAVRYLRPKDQDVNFNQRLEQLLSVSSGPEANEHESIDQLYKAVLAAPSTDANLDPREKKTIRLVLDTVICAREPMSVAIMAKLLGLDDEQDIIYAVQHLRSVLNVSQHANYITPQHASFPAFMLSHERSGEHFCDAAKHNRYLALGCFTTMQRLLRFNICELESSYVLDENIPGLTERIGKIIPPELIYACRYWGDHLTFAEVPDVQSELEDFLSNRLLLWMEVMNLRKSMGSGAQMLSQVHAWLQKSGGANDIVELVLDASRFVAAFGLSPASRSTPHIYISALPFWPETRPVRLHYWKRMQGLMRLEGPAMEERDTSCLASWDAGGNVLCVAFSLDGTLVVSGSSDHNIRVWDARSGHLVAGPFKGHTHRVNSVAFSPDGTLIVSGSSDNTVRVWSAHSGNLEAGPFEGHTDQVRAVAFSPDGGRIASCSDDRTICIWDAHSGDLVVGPLEGHAGSVYTVAYSPDGTRVVSGSSDNTIRLWDAHSGDLVAGPFEGHSGWVYSTIFSPDGTCIISCSSDKTICVWDARNGDLVVGPFTGHTGQVRCVAFSSDGARIVSSSDDRTIRVWDAHSGELVAGPFKGHSGWVYAVAFSPDGTLIVSGSGDQNIRVWDAYSRPIAAASFRGHTGQVRSVAFSPDGACIVSGSEDCTICVWDARSGDLMAGPFERHADQVRSVAYSPDSTRVVSGSDDRTICIWDVRNGDIVAGPFKGHTDCVNSVTFSPDGVRIASGSSDNTVRVWDVGSGDLVAGPFEGHSGWVYSVAFSFDGSYIVSGSEDGTVQIWHAHNGLLVDGPSKGNRSSVHSVAFSPDGTRVASGSEDRTVCVWDAHSGDLIAGPFRGHKHQVNSVAFSPDGTLIISGSSDKVICVWDAHSGDLVAGPLEGHSGRVYSVAFSPDGKSIVSGSGDGTIRTWHTTPTLIPSGDAKYWLIDKQGVVVTQQGQLLLCVPIDVRIGIMRPQNTGCICNGGALTLDFSDTFMGEQWSMCIQTS